MKLLVVSDIHYAGPGEQARRGHEARVIPNWPLRALARAWRRFVWLRDPMAHNHRLDHFIAANPKPDWVVANGDFSLDTGFVGVSDSEAFASAATVLTRLRAAYGDRLLTTIGDHELGKKSLFGGVGGLRLKSWERTVSGLGIPPIWQREVGRYVLIGVASTPLALPVFLPDAQFEEVPSWQEIEAATFASLRAVFRALRPTQRVVLFLHDPTALPFIGRDPEILRYRDQVEHTIVGHLHTPALFHLASVLAGFPRITGIGNSVRRYSAALHEARWWREFKTVLCPSPTGIELLKDGGWLELELSEDPRQRIVIRRLRLPW